MARHEGSPPSMTAVVAVSAITSAVVSGGVLLGVSMGGKLIDTDPRAVPDLSGMTAAGAGAVLQDARLSLIVAGEEHHDDIPAGQICRQEPRAASQVPPDSRIQVWSSLGPEPVRVPTLAGQTLASARAALTRAGLSAGEITEEAGAGPPGSIVRSTPAAGQSVERGATVALVARPATVLVEVPGVVGQSVRRARESITEAGLIVGEERTRFDDLRAPYVVLRQDPEAGAQAPAGSAVDLIVNEGD